MKLFEHTSSSLHKENISHWNKIYKRYGENMPSGNRITGRTIKKIKTIIEVYTISVKEVFHIRWSVNFSIIHGDKNRLETVAMVTAITGRNNFVTRSSLIPSRPLRQSISYKDDRIVCGMFDNVDFSFK